MSSSVCETWGWVVEEVAPDVLVTLDENAPISAPIKLGRWLLFVKNIRIKTSIISPCF
jgi:hypothetical protein